LAAPKGKKRTSSKTVASLQPKTQKTSKPAGRPSLYNEETALEVCVEVANGSNLTAIGQRADMPSERTLRDWAANNETFSQMYARARELRADARADRIDSYVTRTIAGEIDAQVARVAIDAEKWQAAKEQPRRYGDKVSAELTGKDGEALIPADGSSRDLARAILDILRESKVTDGQQE
jgi:hypothetical protein